MGSDTEVHIKRDGINALVVPEWAEQFDPGWFDPDYWGERAVPVSSGGVGVPGLLRAARNIGCFVITVGED